MRQAAQQSTSHSQVNECFTRGGKVLVVSAHPSVAREPGECPLYYPPLWKRLKPYRAFPSYHHLQLPLPTICLLDPLIELGIPVPVVRKHLAHPLQPTLLLRPLK